MDQYPPPQSQRAGRPAAGVKLTKSNNFIHSAPPQAATEISVSRPNRDRQTVAQFAAAHLSGRIATKACFAKQNACQ
jgi:hypothetical protein